jgi:hypothetical protein
LARLELGLGGLFGRPCHRLMAFGAIGKGLTPRGNGARFSTDRAPDPFFPYPLLFDFRRFGLARLR